MKDTYKLSRNSGCPCGSGIKYKKCCDGKIDWDSIVTGPAGIYNRHLSLRGKNILFIESILAALQLDQIKTGFDFSKFKGAFTPKAVRQIHQAIIDIWPDKTDCKRILSDQRGQVTALYTGSYEPEDIFRAVTRHTLYSERILLSDPFLYPLYVKDELSPLLHPEMHVSTTIKWCYLWLSLTPWIEDGLVNFVRTPWDMDFNEKRTILEIQREKIESSPELQNLTKRFVDETVDNMTALNRGMKEFFILSQSDDYLLAIFRDAPKESPFLTETEYLGFINARRQSHPFYVDHPRNTGSQFLHDSSGLCYEEAKRVCAITNSHIITNYKTRWKEVELDHEYATGATGVWSPFAKALQNADLKILNDVPMDAALQLRRNQRLEPMRNFFNRVWRSCHDAEPFSEANAQNLAAELDERIGEARSEWSDIDKELFKWVGASGGVLLSSGLIGFVPAAAASAFTGLAGLTLAQWQRHSFKNRFPAGFFLGIK